MLLSLNCFDEKKCAIIAFFQGFEFVFKALADKFLHPSPFFFQCLCLEYTADLAVSFILRLEFQVVEYKGKRKSYISPFSFKSLCCIVVLILISLYWRPLGESLMRKKCCNCPLFLYVKF